MQSLLPVVGFYLQPLRHEVQKDPKKLKIGIKDITDIFSNIEQIVTIHNQLLASLNELEKDWPFLSRLGKVFVDIASSFKAYTVYLQNHSNAKSILQMLLQTNQKFAKWLLEVDRKLSALSEVPSGRHTANMGDITSRGLRKTGSTSIMLTGRKTAEMVYDVEGNVICKLIALLDIPVGRIDFYKSSFKSLADRTPQGHHLQRNILDAYSILQQTVSVLSKNVKEADSRAKIMDIERKIVSPSRPISLVQQNRSYIGECTFASDHLFLFSDCVLLVKAKARGKATYDFKDMAMLEKVELVEKDKTTFKLEYVEEGAKKGKVSWKLSCKSKEHKEEWMEKLRYTIEQNSLSGVFGVELSVVVKRENRPSEIPGVVEVCGMLVLNGGLKKEGIFRLAPNIESRNKAKTAFNKQKAEDVQLTVFAPEGDNYILAASLIKDYLRDLPEPLLKFELYKSFMEAHDAYEKATLVRNGEVSAHKSHIEKLKALISKIGPYNQKLLFYLLRLMNITSQSSQHNKMTASNLSIVLAPNILRPQIEDMEYSLLIPKVNALVEFLIVNYDKFID